jgi:hypothetical protein
VFVIFYIDFEVIDLREWGDNFFFDSHRICRAFLSEFSVAHFDEVESFRPQS